MCKLEEPKAFRQDEGGATAVEFALVAPVLCFMLLSLLEIGMLGMMASGVDNAVLQVSRTIRTGQSDGPATATAFKDQICAKLGGNATTCKSRLKISVQKYSHFSDANAVAESQPADQFNKGAPGDIMIVKANYKWPLMTPFVATAYDRDGPMEVTLAARIAFKNEPYQ